MNDTQGPIGFQTCYTYKQVCRPVSRLISFAFGPLKIEILDTEGNVEISRPVPVTTIRSTIVIISSAAVVVVKLSRAQGKSTNDDLRIHLEDRDPE